MSSRAPDPEYRHNAAQSLRALRHADMPGYDPMCQRPDRDSAALPVAMRAPRARGRRGGPVIGGAAWFSEIGTRRSNEDSCAYWWTGNAFFAAVADGLGGMPGGGEASRCAIRELQERARASMASATGIEELVRGCHRRLGELQRQDPAHAAMATTLTVVAACGDRLAIAHCGDTRLYRLRGGASEQLTRDHSEAQRLLDAGVLTADEFASYPRRHILESALGIVGEPMVQAFEDRLCAGDWLVLASDGAYTRLEPGDLPAIAGAASGARDFVTECRTRIEARGPQDNYTVVVARAAARTGLVAGARRLLGRRRAGGNVP